MTPRYKDFLNQPILSLSKTDHLTGRDFVQGGTLIVGDPGSGKSSTSSKQIICAFMRAGMGGVLHTVKSEDTANYLEYARECGREKDVIVFSEESGLTFDPLAYEWSRTTGRGAGSIESCIDYFSTLLSIGKPQGGGAESRFWDLAAEQLMRNAIQLIKLAGESLSIVNIARAIASFPQQANEQEDRAWQDRSYTASLIEDIRRKQDSITADQWQDLDVSTDFIFDRWPNLDPRPRSSIEMTFAGLADKFMYNPMRKIFASGTFSFTPEETTHKRKILIIDFPVLEYGKETARLIQIMVKLTFQRAWLRHKYTPGCCHGAFLVQDEFQLLTSRFESHFAQTCRGSGIAMLCITQTILNLAEELGETQPGSKTKAFLGNLGLKIAHRTTCFDTATYFADVIGKEWKFVGNFSSGSGSEAGQSQASVGGSHQLVHVVDPIEFTRLQRPDSTNPNATAIVYRGGDIFHATKTERNTQGRNFLRVSFTRE
jgi:type IV secretory pathway TraG/TraD family ATPase VirD4